MDRTTQAYMTFAAIMLVLVAFISQRTLHALGDANYASPLSLAKIPACGYVGLQPLNAAELDRLGLGGPSPIKEPPLSPFNQAGMYWSEDFAVAKGDIIQIAVHGDSPVSWFGVDWSNFDLRGILATNELDEDGKSFDPQYPSGSSVRSGSDGFSLSLSYEFIQDTECVVVVKNNNASSPGRIEVQVSPKPASTIKKLLDLLAIANGPSKTDNEEVGFPN